MGTTNYGNQILSFDFKEPGKAENFNRINYKLLPVGIYEGGTLTKIDSTTVQLSQFVAYIEDTINNVGIRIQTSATVNLTVAPSTPYIIIRFGWANVENNYADIIAIDYSSIDSKDIIVGRCAYDSGNNLLNTFDYTRRIKSSLQEVDDDYEKLRVYPTEPPSNKVHVSAGKLNILNKPFDFTGGDSPVISDTTDGRIDLVYIDDSGDLQILEGVDNASPSEPAFPSRGFTLGKITRGSAETVIRGDEIELFDFDAITGGGASSGGGGGSSIEATTGESITVGDIVYFEDDGKLYKADNNEFKKSIVAGVALETGGADSLINVGKLGKAQFYSGLSIGAEYYLGENGGMVVLGALDYTKQKVHIGTAIADDTLDLFVQIPEPTRNYDDGSPIGSIRYFSTYKDRSAYGYLSFDFDNAISIANYPKLFEEIGHLYNDQHVAAGDADLSGSSTLFYPTPVPGAYDRVAIPDSGDIDSTSAIDTGNDTITLSQADYNKFKRMKYYSDSYNGVPVYLKLESGSLPTGLSEDTIYYLRFTNDANYYVKLYTSEANAIDDTSAVDITATATGTFRLTQEGINLDDAFQGHIHAQFSGQVSWNNGAGALGGGGSFAQIDGNNRSTGLVKTDATNGTPRTTNETRPKTNFLYGYIKAEYVTTAGEPISALRYDTGWVANSDWTNTEFTINHNLDMDLGNLIVKIFYSATGGDSDSFELTNPSWNSDTASLQNVGFGIYNIDSNNILIGFGYDGVGYLNKDNNLTTSILSSTSGYYRVVVTKPNLVSTVFDVSSLPKTYDLTSGDVTVTLPEITGAMQTKSIYWTNGGTYKLRIKDADDNYLDYEGEGEGHILLELDGSNWQVRAYEDTKNITNSSPDYNRIYKKFIDGTCELSGYVTTAASSGFNTATFGVTLNTVENVVATLNSNNAAGYTFTKNLNTTSVLLYQTVSTSEKIWYVVRGTWK